MGAPFIAHGYQTKSDKNLWFVLLNRTKNVSYELLITFKNRLKDYRQTHSKGIMILATIATIFEVWVHFGSTTAPKQTRPDTRPSVMYGWAGAVILKNRQKTYFYESVTN